MDYQNYYTRRMARPRVGPIPQEKERIVMPIVIDYTGPMYKRVIIDKTILLQLNANIRCLLLKRF